MPKPNGTPSIKSKPFVIAIDGPAGAGKSTVAKLLAKRLQISYLDTGAMYRSLTLKAIRSGVKLEDGKALAQLAQKTKIELKTGSDGLKVYLDGQDVSLDIRTPEVTNQTFYAARAPEVREILVRWQQEIGQSQSVVAEGRDIGTVVFPQAPKKFYLDADFKVRALRRFKELQEKDKQVAIDQVQEDLQDRDHKDFSRAVGPLKKADDAIVIESTGLTVEQTVDKILSYLK